MKKILILFLIVALGISCNDGKKDDEKVRYTQDSEEINTMKAAISDYEKGNWDAMKKHYADTAQIFHNSTDGKRIGDIIKTHEEGLQGLSSYGFADEDQDYEMVLTDDGHTWVNYWGEWQGTIEGSDKKVSVPVHLTARFENGKIVREYAYWDNSIMMMAMQEMDTTATKNDSIQAPSN